MAELQVTIGRLSLRFGSPAGTRADLAEEHERANAAALAKALRDVPPDAGSTAGRAAAHAERAAAEAEEVTSAVERASDLAEALAKGLTLDPKALEQQVDAILDVAARADRDGRWKDEIRLARSVVTLLALVPRWIALAKTLQRALAAAEALRDGSAAAWAHHEAGTFALGAGDAHAATRHLGEALRLRGALGEEAAAELTRHNLELVATVATDGQLEPVRRAGRLSRLGRRGLVGAILAGGVLLLAGGLALAEAIGDRPTIGELRTSDATDARDVDGETRTGQPATETDRTVQTEDTTAAARPDLAVDATPTGFTIANVGDADASEFDVTVSGLEPQRSRGLEAGGSVSADLGCEEKPREVAVDPLENPDADPTNDVDVSEPCSDLAVANEPGPGGFIVKNVGGSDAGAFAVDVRGVDTFVFDGLRVGESVEDAVECVEGTPSAVVDPDNEVPELDEANNSIDLGCPDVD